MEAFFIVGAVVGLPIIYYGLQKPVVEVREEERAKGEQVYEEITVSRFNARQRQERILEHMTPAEKSAFLSASEFKPLPKLDIDDGFVRFTNVCMTVLLISLATLLISYLSDNKLPYFLTKSDL